MTEAQLAGRMSIDVDYRSVIDVPAPGLNESWKAKGRLARSNDSNTVAWLKLRLHHSIPLRRSNISRSRQQHPRIKNVNVPPLTRVIVSVLTLGPRQSFRNPAT